MNSLQELNNFGAINIDFIDQRSSGVVFDRLFPLTAQDQDIVINSTTITPDPGINIVEIINYQTANVRYRVTIRPGTSNPLVGSTITWNLLPSGATLVQSGNEYTISGIHTVDDWEGVKNYIWTLPMDYASYPLWYLDVDVIYYNSSLAQEVIMNWVVYDDRFFYVSEMTASANMLVYGGVNSPATAALTASAIVISETRNFIGFQLSATASANVTCVGDLNITFFNAKATMSVIAGANSPANIALTAKATVTASLLSTVVNLDPRNYRTKTHQLMFSTNTPSMDTVDNVNDIVSITLSSSLGRWATNITGTPTSTLTITGTKSQVNADILNVYFWPDVGQTSNGTFTWLHKINNVTIFTTNVALTAVADSYTPVIYEFTSSTTWTPTYANTYYGGLIDVLAIGGGGGGANLFNQRSGGGGGGGAVKEWFNAPCYSTAYTVSVASYSSGFGNASYLQNPTSGNASPGNNLGVDYFYAAGGFAGYEGAIGIGLARAGNGGASGTPWAGGTGSTQQNIYGGAGGGGGAGGTGYNGLGGVGGNGGFGVLSSITNTYYGGGGGGGGGSGAVGGGAIHGGGNGAGGGSQFAGIGGRGGGGGGGGSSKQGASGGPGYIYIKVHGL
jgi:hypothetical protein